MHGISWLHVAFRDHHVGACDGKQPDHRYGVVPKHRSWLEVACGRCGGGCDLGNVQKLLSNQTNSRLVCGNRDCLIGCTEHRNSNAGACGGGVDWYSIPKEGICSACRTF